MIGIENLRINAKLPPTGVTRTGEQTIRSADEFVKLMLRSKHKDVEFFDETYVDRRRAIVDMNVNFPSMGIYVVDSKKEKVEEGRPATARNQELILTPDSHLTAISCEFLLGTDHAYQWPVKIAAKTEGGFKLDVAFEEAEVMLKDRGFEISSEVVTLDAIKNPSFMFGCEVRRPEKARSVIINGMRETWWLELPHRLDFYLVNAEVHESEGSIVVWAMPGVIVEAGVKARDLGVKKPKNIRDITGMKKFWDFASIVGLPTFSIFRNLEGIFNKGQDYEHRGYALVAENAAIVNK